MAAAYGNRCLAFLESLAVPTPVLAAGTGGAVEAAAQLRVLAAERALAERPPAIVLRRALIRPLPLPGLGTGVPASLPARRALAARADTCTLLGTSCHPSDPHPPSS